MDLPAFLSLVERLESEEARDPASYRIRLWLLALLGYVYLLTMIALLASVLYLVHRSRLSGVLFVLYVEIPLFFLLLAAVRSLFVRLPTPVGYPLTRDDAPRLFDLIDEVSAATGSSPVHHVILTGELNAGVAQFPRFGVLGSARNHLVLGLPLLHALSPGQFRAVLAHEFGHLGGSHGRFGAWIYRIRRTWTLMQQYWHAGRSRLGALLFGHFLDWYAPYFNAYSFVLARAQEREADEGMLQVAGAQDSSVALARLELIGRSLQPRLEAYFREQLLAREAPPPDAWRTITAWAREGPESAEGRRLLVAALAVRTDVSDTHPALRDRLARFNPPGGGAAVVEAALLNPASTAATSYLGAEGIRLAAAVDEVWSVLHEAGWRESHRQIVEAAARIQALASSAEKKRPTDAEDEERLELTEGVYGLAAAVSLAREAHQRHPGNIRIRFFLGRALLAQGDLAGIDHLEAVRQADPGAAEAVSVLLFQHHWELGATEEAETHRRHAAERQIQEDRVRKERTSVPRRIRISPHGLHPEHVAALRRALYLQDDLDAVYLVRREVRIEPERPCWLAVLVRQRSFFSAPGHMALARLVNRVFTQVPWPVQTYCALAEGIPASVVWRVRRVPFAALLSHELDAPPPPGDKTSLAVLKKVEQLRQRARVRRRDRRLGAALIVAFAALLAWAFIG